MEEIHLRLSPSLKDSVTDYARSHGMDLSTAIRDLLRRQVRYWRWTKKRESSGPSEDTLRHYGRQGLERDSNATKTQLFHFIARRAGRYVDSATIDRIANELTNNEHPEADD